LGEGSTTWRHQQYARETECRRHASPKGFRADRDHGDSPAGGDSVDMTLDRTDVRILR